MPKPKVKIQTSVQSSPAEMEAAAAAAADPGPAEEAPKVSGFSFGPDSGGEQTKPTSDDRISIPLKGGQIHLGSMRDATKQKLVEAIKATPDLMPGPTRVEAAEIPDFAYAVIYNLVGWCESFIAERSGFDRNLCRRAFNYGPQEIAMLKAPTGAVLGKYVGHLGNYQEETFLLVALLNIHMAKIQWLREEQQKLQVKPDGLGAASASDTRM